MSHERNNSSENSDSLEPIQRTLSSFAPAPVQIDRDRLMFLAGQANAMASGGPRTDAQRWSAPGGEGDSFNLITGRLTPPARHSRGGHSSWLWPTATATFAATSLALAMTLAIRSTPHPQVVYRDRPVSALVVSGPLQAERPAAEREVTIANQPIIREAAWTSVPQNNYVRTREVALRMGLDAIGSPAATNGIQSAPATYGALFEGLVGAGQWPDSAAGFENPPNM